MRFLVLFRENTRVSSKVLERMFHHLVDLKKQGKVVGDSTFAAGQGVAAIFDVVSEEELAQLVHGTPIHDQCTVETVPLSDDSDFPVTFGKHKGHLAAWEKVMAGRSNDVTS